MLERLAREYEGKVRIVEFDIDQSPETPSQFGIMAIPTLLFFKEGKEVDRMTGGSEAGLRKKLQAL